MAMRVSRVSRGLARAKADAGAFAPAAGASQQRQFSSDVATTTSSSAVAAPIPKVAGRSGQSGVTATVFGATGFLGRYVINRLGRIGSQCIIPYRGDGSNTRHLKPMGDLGQIIPLPMQLHDDESVHNTVKRSNVVVNLIGNRLETKNFNFHDTHVKCTFKVAQAAKNAGVERFIHVSALGADKNSTSAFLRSKAEGEEVVKQIYPDATIIRPAPIFGDEDYFLNRFGDMVRILPIVPELEMGKAKVQPVFCVDVATAIMNAVGDSRSIGKTYEFGGGEVVTMKDILDSTFEHTYIEDSRMSMPIEVARVYGQVLEQLPARWASITSDMIDQFAEDQICGKVPGVYQITDLGINRPVPLKERVARYLALHAGNRAPEKYTGYE